jgi:hypothetical protein
MVYSFQALRQAALPFEWASDLALEVVGQTPPATGAAVCR